MSQNFSDKSTPDENQAEIESLVAAFYTERAPQSNRADHLWRQLEPRLETVPARPRKFGFWFNNFNTARNNIMQTETPLFDHEDEIPAKPPRRSQVGSLFGGLTSVILIAGLILVISLATGSKAPQSGPPVGSQVVQSSVAPASTVMPPTATPKPFDGTPLAGSNSNASPTATPFVEPTPTMVGDTRPPTVSPVAGGPTVVPGRLPTPTPATSIPTSSTDPNPTINLAGTLTVTVKYLQVVPINFNQNALPPLVRATNPAVSYYGALQGGITVLTELHTALVAAGYKYTNPDDYTSPAGSAAAAPQWQPTGTAAFYTKEGRPDLYITVANLPTSEEVKQYIANGFDTGMSDYEGVIEGMRGKGFKTVVTLTGGYNLLQVMRYGQDPGAGSPTVSPQPTK